ncbi:hypothetical protein OG369_14190 [Streptomyces sp. NBC_01221]|nr:hypothetical protein [Streptomyces sp. NBC_01221]MCX4787294.1 hypothetical protein [Streptomyces sp. NBC_01221]WSP55596.1 hypothetical protein OG306_15235 [Streptomyces sp. NBC_01241]WSU23676.1 hypothetical protein OG508_23875 [Streptomyces sp. NBC_01108]
MPRGPQAWRQTPATSRHGDLQDDVLAHLDNDFGRYGDAYASMKRRMHELIGSTRRIYINADMLDRDVRDRTLARLAE